ncbi:ParM/StbA family protein [Psychrobacillus sp. OK032]|uniref:ParM/StbA family protein n=1 Tax=Psychrobacillus sp. OK032 TaxID=1884358 RepID=UPI0008C04515|nr:hypothetical protein [Psychrobacillus sp. OK032]SER86970.1 plasmid segregation protein ParM [Psychrobacillus sp. OK032]
MRNLILGIDAGNYNAKTAGAYGVDIYRTAICDWFSRDIVDKHGDDDMEFELNGRRGFAGTIAANEDQFGVTSLYGDTKAHEDTLIRVLLAIYRYTSKFFLDIDRFSIVCSQPIATHNADEKAKLRDLLRGTHDITVNGVHKRYTIEEVGIAAEGSVAYLANPQLGEVRIIDIGSGTTNCATIRDKRHINTASDTFNFGMETLANNASLAEVARGIIRATTSLKWRKNDVVYACGGVASDILPLLQAHYTRAKLLTPYLRQLDGSIVTLPPVYANAVGNYEVARRTFR